MIPHLGLVRRSRAIGGAYAATRVEIVAARPGNPLGAAVRRFGDAVACLAPPFGEHAFNRAFGFSDERLGAAREVIDWYAAAPAPRRRRLSPRSSPRAGPAR